MAAGPVVPIVDVTCGTGDNVAVTGTASLFWVSACKVKAMMVAAWSSTERVGVVPGMLQATMIIKIMDKNVNFCLSFICITDGIVDAIIS